eukprot:201954-Chlamydomonas_euryale.AAC.3
MAGSVMDQGTMASGFLFPRREGRRGGDEVGVTPTPRLREGARGSRPEDADVPHPLGRPAPPALRRRPRRPPHPQLRRSARRSPTPTRVTQSGARHAAPLLLSSRSPGLPCSSSPHPLSDSRRAKGTTTDCAPAPSPSHGVRLGRRLWRYVRLLPVAAAAATAAAAAAVSMQPAYWLQAVRKTSHAADAARKGGAASAVVHARASHVPPRAPVLPESFRRRARPPAAHGRARRRAQGRGFKGALRWCIAARDGGGA